MVIPWFWSSKLQAPAGEAFSPGFEIVAIAWAGAPGRDVGASQGGGIVQGRENGLILQTLKEYGNHFLSD